MFQSKVGLIVVSSNGPVAWGMQGFVTAVAATAGANVIRSCWSALPDDVVLDESMLEFMVTSGWTSEAVVFVATQVDRFRSLRDLGERVLRHEPNSFRGEHTGAEKLI